jgi:hypothetical protein
METVIADLKDKVISLIPDKNGALILRFAMKRSTCIHNHEPASELFTGVTASYFVADWARETRRTEGEREAARRFCIQWPDGPQV